MKFILWLLCIVYCISPVDFVPGPLDDAIVAFAVFGLTSLMGRGNNGSNGTQQN